MFQLNVGRTKETWNGINSLLSKSKNSTTIPKILQDEIEITDPVTISNVFIIKNIQQTSLKSDLN